MLSGIEMNQVEGTNSNCRKGAVLLPSYGMLRIPDLSSFLPELADIVFRLWGHRDDFDVVLGWGHKETARRARALAQRRKIPYLALEDGFLRSVQPGVTGAPPLSLVLDPVGMYYNSTGPSQLENLLQDHDFEETDFLLRARNAIKTIVEGRLSKYNHAPLLDRPLPGPRQEKVLLVDQTFGDASVTYGMADESTFDRMLTAALEENPEADIVVKTHPDVVAGKKRGYLCALNHPSPRVHILAEDLNPLSVIEKADRVYVVTSQMGFEALLAGKPVECFGMPFYAGWGLTRDRQSCPRRTRKRTLEELFAAAYILYPRYLDPETGEQGTIEDVIDHLLRQRDAHLVDTGRIVCTGFRWWKRPYIRRALSSPGNRVIFSDSARDLAAADKVMVWGAGAGSTMVREAEKQGIPVHRMEDGFLRSVGLGSNLVRPLSLVVDTQGIYFDPTGPSDLETLLRQTEFTEELRRRGAELRRRILSGRLSKYNVGSDEPLRLSARPGQRTLLVPGQVEDDASIRLGCVDIRTNLDLLDEVRSRNPDAFILYKPHPDVLAKNREGAVSAEEAGRYCDLVVTDRAMPACLAAVGEVHTMTSLTGFEALLQGKKVVTYGLPFYAGWGLTEDRHASPRRGRELKIEEMVAAALILYPRYIDWKRGCLISAETALNRLAAERAAREEGEGENGFVARWSRKLSGFLEGIL